MRAPGRVVGLDSVPWYGPYSIAAIPLQSVRAMGERRRVVGAAGGALGLSGFAAALGMCCSVPWAVALLGVTGAVAFARLAFLLPYALIASAALLAMGFWWAYRPVAQCAD